MNTTKKFAIVFGFLYLICAIFYLLGFGQVQSQLDPVTPPITFWISLVGFFPFGWVTLGCMGSDIGTSCLIITKYIGILLNLVLYSSIGALLGWIVSKVFYKTN